MMTEEVLNMEPEEGLEKVRDATRVLSAYRSCFEQKRNRLEEYFKDKPVVSWAFQSKLVFNRVEKLEHRIHLVRVSLWCGC